MIKKIVPILLLLLVCLQPLMAKKSLKKSSKKSSSNAPFIMLVAGTGLSIPIGQVREETSLLLPALLSFQITFFENISIEADGTYNYYSLNNESTSSLSFIQASAGGRYWFMDTFDGIYAGAGIGWMMKSVTTENSYFNSSTSSNETEYLDTTDQCFAYHAKAGYVLTVDPVKIDIGLRYDLSNLAYTQSASLIVAAGLTF